MLDETKISELTPYTLLERENFFDLAEMEPEEQARISALLILKAKEFGIQKEYKVAMKALAEAVRPQRQLLKTMLRCLKTTLNLLT